MRAYFYLLFGPGLLLLSLLVSTLYSALQGSPISSKQSAKQMCFYEKERRLLVLALHNESKKPLLDHLARSLAQLIADRLRALNYVSVEKARRLLCLRSEAASKVKEHRRYYSREGGFTREGELALSLAADKNQQTRIELVIKHKNIALPFQKAKDKEALLKAAENFQVEYLLAGRLLAMGPKDLIDSKEQNLRYEFSFIDAVHKRSYGFSIDLKQNRPYAKLDELIQKMQGILWGQNAVLVSFQSTQPGAMIYLNERYLGRTPLSQKVLAGKYKLRVVQEGYQNVNKTVDIAAHKQRNFQITNTVEQGKASLYVQSQPSGAAVYLNLRYLGQTPLRIEGLPRGTHRLCLRKETYIDTYVGVQLEANKVQKLNLSMKPGDTLTYYKDWHYVIGSLTYFDLALYSGLSSLAFYAGWLYFSAQGQNAEDRAQRDVNAQGENSKAKDSYQYARISAALGIFSFLGAGYFLYQGLDLGGPSFGEVSALPPASKSEWLLKASLKLEASSSSVEQFAKGEAQGLEAKAGIRIAF